MNEGRRSRGDSAQLRTDVLFQKWPFLSQVSCCGFRTPPGASSDSGLRVSPGKISVRQTQKLPQGPTNSCSATVCLDAVLSADWDSETWGHGISKKIFKNEPSGNDTRWDRFWWKTLSGTHTRSDEIRCKTNQRETSGESWGVSACFFFFFSFFLKKRNVTQWSETETQRSQPNTLDDILTTSLIQEVGKKNPAWCIINITTGVFICLRCSEICWKVNSCCKFGVNGNTTSNHRGSKVVSFSRMSDGKR